MPKTSANKSVTNADMKTALQQHTKSLKQWTEDRFEKQEMLLQQSEDRQTEELKQFMRKIVTESEARMTKHFNQAISKAVSESEERTKYHFDVTAENIHKDVAGANKDKVSLLENKSDEHEQRITALEQTAGLRA